MTATLLLVAALIPAMGEIREHPGGKAPLLDVTVDAVQESVKSLR